MVELEHNSGLSAEGLEERRFTDVFNVSANGPNQPVPEIRNAFDVARANPTTPISPEMQATTGLDNVLNPSGPAIDLSYHEKLDLSADASAVDLDDTQPGMSDSLLGACCSVVQEATAEVGGLVNGAKPAPLPQPTMTVNNTMKMSMNA